MEDLREFDEEVPGEFEESQKAMLAELMDERAERQKLFATFTREELLLHLQRLHAQRELLEECADEWMERLRTAREKMRLVRDICALAKQEREERRAKREPARTKCLSLLDTKSVQ